MPLSSVVGAQSIIKPGVCTSSTRPAVPYIGQCIYETDTSLAKVWDGSAWSEYPAGKANLASPTFTGTPAAPTATAGTNTTQLATTAFANAAGGLVFIKSQTVVSGEAATALTNVFSATYDNYRVIVTGLQTTASQGLALQMGTTATGYYGNMVYALYSATAWTFVPTSNLNFWYVGLTDGGAPSTSSTFDLINPFLSVRTQQNGNYYGRGYTGNFSGSLENTTSYTGFRLFNDVSGTMSAGTIRVYGYRNS